MRRSDPGFSLLEVMAAVAVVAIVFTTLASVANQGLFSEGVSRRRFEASLLADEVLAEIEENAAAGIAPELGESESEEGIYRVVVAVSAFDLAAAVAPPADAQGITPAKATEAGEAVLPENAVRAVEVAVLWSEGVEEYRVRRTTYALDAAALEPPAGLAPGGLGTGAGQTGPLQLPNLPSLPGGSGR